MLNPDFKDFIQSLNAHSVRYLVVGGYAVALHGYPRPKNDVDIWIKSSPENATQVIAALQQSGYGYLGLQEQDILEADTVIQEGYPPRKIALLTILPGVDFETCYDMKLVVDLDEVPVNIIDLENLKKYKRAMGRAQDIADLENLE